MSSLFDSARDPEAGKRSAKAAPSPAGVRAGVKPSRKTGPKLAAKLAEPALVPQAHGGGLYDGGVIGHNGSNAGRPPSELRARLRGSFADRVAVLEEIADNPQSSAGDRIRAVDLLAKYGLGAATELTTDAVRERLVATITLLREALPAESFNSLLPRLRTIWTN